MAMFDEISNSLSGFLDGDADSFDAAEATRSVLEAIRDNAPSDAVRQFAEAVLAENPAPPTISCEEAVSILRARWDSYTEQAEAAAKNHNP